MTSGTTRETPAPDTAAFFAPGRSEGSYLSSGGPLTVRRLLVRALACCVALVLVDVAVGAVRTPRAEFLADYRLPRSMPTSEIADYADAVEASARDDGPPVALFLGASPTWGHRIEDPADTFPYAFRDAADRGGTKVRAFNLACNGQYVGDQYVIARRLLASAEVVYVQLTYHTFNPASHDDPMRYPELARLLGVTLSPDEVRALRLPASGTGPTAAVDAALSRYWLLWRERDALDRRLFGSRPAAAVERLAAAVNDEEYRTDEDPGGAFVGFDALEPEQQMVAISAYAEDSSFDVRPGDSEVRLLERLAALLEASGKRGVFYVAPLNRDLVSRYELIDPARYRRNVAVLRRAVEGRGQTLIDYNDGPVALDAGSFADISHTTAAGGRAFGVMLWRDTSSTVTAVRR